MIEAARIARGNVKSIQDLKVDEFDAIFMPGGVGATKHWSDFALKGADQMKVRDDVQNVLK